MSFEIVSNSGQRLPLRPQDLAVQSAPPSMDAIFRDENGHRYSAVFDGSHVIFNDGSADFIGRWVQGSAATVIRQTRRLHKVFNLHFSIMDLARSDSTLCGPFKGPCHRQSLRGSKRDFQFPSPIAPGTAIIPPRSICGTKAHASLEPTPRTSPFRWIKQAAKPGAKSTLENSIRLPASASASCYIILNAGDEVPRTAEVGAIKQTAQNSSTARSQCNIN